MREGLPNHQNHGSQQLARFVVEYRTQPRPMIDLLPNNGASRLMVVEIWLLKDNLLLLPKIFSLMMMAMKMMILAILMTPKNSWMIFFFWPTKPSSLASNMQLILDWCTPETPSDDYDADDGSDDDGFR